MKRSTSLCLIGVAGFIGCAEPNTPVVSSGSPSAQVSTEIGEALTFVSLKVPNMH